MTTEIPHSLDAVILAVQALIDGRPMPAEWSKEDTQPAAPPPTHDDGSVMQAISDLIDQKLAAMPKPEPIAAVEPLVEPAMIVAAAAEAFKDQVKPIADAVANVGNRVSAIEQAPPSPEIPALQQALVDLASHLEKLQQAQVPTAAPPEVLLLVDKQQKTQTLKNEELEARVSMLEQIIDGLSAAVHKDDAA